MNMFAYIFILQDLWQTSRSKMTFQLFPIIWEGLIWVKIQEKCFFSPWFSVWFMSSCSTADLMAAVADRVDRDFSMPGAGWLVAFDISNDLDTVQHAGPLHKFKSWGISWVFSLIFHFSVIDTFYYLWYSCPALDH